MDLSVLIGPILVGGSKAQVVESPALTASMQKPLRNLLPKPDGGRSRTFFVKAKTSQGKALLQSERMATLFIDVLRSFAGDARFKIHEFAVMRNLSS